MHDQVIGAAQLACFYRSLYRVRRVEEEVVRVYPTDVIQSPVHLSIGQEAVSVGVCAALQPHDVVFATYRGHAAYLAKGGDLKRMVAELYGKVTGCARGKGGSMHLIDVAAGVMGTSAIVATTIPQAVGYAYAVKLAGRHAVVVVFFGDGAVEEGVFYESVNFAALKCLPVLFVCENNLYSIHAHISTRQARQNLCGRVEAFGVPAVAVADGDVINIFSSAREAVRSIRDGAGPRMIECLTYRWKEHVGPEDDFDRGYRSRTEAEAWFAQDAVRVVAGLLPPPVRVRIEDEVELEIADAFAFARQSAVPPAGELLEDVLV